MSPLPAPRPPLRGRISLRAALMAGACLGLSSLAPSAQEAADLTLSTIEVEGDGTGNTGFFGETFAQSAAPVLKTDTPLLETPRSVSVVTQQQLQERGARTVTQALQYTPGVFAGNYGVDNRGDWQDVRGFEATTYEDGLQAQYGYYNNTKPEAFLLDSVAVLKGPSGMLFGNGAVGGIINTTSKLPDPDAPNIVQLDFGSHDLFQAGIDTGGTLDREGRLRYRLVALGRTAKAQVDHTRDDARAFMPSLSFSPDENTTLTLLGLYQKTETNPMIQFLSTYGTLWSAEEFGNGDFLDPDTFVGEPDFDSYDAERRSVMLTGEHRLSDAWKIDGRLRYIASKVSYQQAYWAYDNFETGRYTPDGTINRTAEAADNDSHSWTGDVHASGRFTLGPTAHEALIGASFTDGRFNYDSGIVETGGPIDPFDPDYTGVVGDIVIVNSPEMTLRQQSVYAQDRITLRDRLSLEVGLRYDWIKTDLQTWDPANPFVTQDDGELSTSAALLYTFDNGVVPYVSYSESFFQEAAGFDASGNPFEPTRGKQLEAGVKYQPPGTSSLLTASVFEITKSNTLKTDPANPIYSIQTGEAKSRGIELGAQARWREFSIDAGYAYLDTEDEAGARFAGAPRNQASAWLQYDATGQLAGLTAGFGVRYVGATSDGTVETPDFTLYDAMLGYSWDRYMVRLTGRNLADKAYLTNCTSSDCYFGETRTIGLSLTAQL